MVKDNIESVFNKLEGFNNQFKDYAGKTDSQLTEIADFIWILN